MPIAKPVRSERANVKPSTGSDTRTVARIEREKIRRDFRNERDELPGEERAGDPASTTHEQTFENKKSQHAGARGAERHAQRDLAAAPAEADEQQISDIAAGDEQNEADRGEESGESRPQFPLRDPPAAA